MLRKIAQRTSRQTEIFLESIEQRSVHVDALVIAAFTFFIGFVVLLASMMCGVAFLPDISVTSQIKKELGFAYALNWSANNLLLFPIMMYFAVHFFKAHTSAIRTSMPGILPKSDLGQAWRSERLALSWCLLIIVLLGFSYIYFDWRARALDAFILQKNEVNQHDWSNAIYLLISGSMDGLPTSPIRTLIFSALAYIMLALHLIVFMFVTLYMGMACRFWFRISDGLGESLENPDRAALLILLSRMILAQIICFCLLLVLCVCMRLNETYLASESPDLWSFVLMAGEHSFRPFQALVQHVGGASSAADGGFLSDVFDIRRLYIPRDPELNKLNSGLTVSAVLLMVIPSLCLAASIHAFEEVRGKHPNKQDFLLEKITPDYIVSFKTVKELCTTLIVCVIVLSFADLFIVLFLTKFVSGKARTFFDRLRRK